ncbi:MAG: DUF885 domain-containing protein [Phycisphaerales bacterium]
MRTSPPTRLRLALLPALLAAAGATVGALQAGAPADALQSAPAPTKTPARTGEDAASRFHAITDELQRWRDTEYPESALEDGRPTPTPDRITDASLRGIEMRHAQAGAFLAELLAIDASQLAGEDLLNWQLLTREMKLGQEVHRFRSFLMPVGGRMGPQQEIPQMADRVPFRTQADYENYLKRLTAVPQMVRDVRVLMETGVAEGRVPAKATMTDVPAQFDAVIRGGLAQLKAPLAKMPASIPAERQQALRAELDALLPPILEELANMRAYLIAGYLPACRDTVGASTLPDGRALYELALRIHTTTDLDAKTIHETGVREVARIRGEMLAVIRRTDWYAADAARAKLADDALFAAFVAYLRTDARFYAKSEEELLARYRDVCKQIDAKLPALFGVLPRNTYGVHAVPKFMAPTQTTAYYQPGSLRAGNPGWFCANTYALDQRPLYEMIPLSLHEAVPGHHLQISLAQELPEQPEFRRQMGFTAFVEGWALYAERLGIEMGFFENDPYADFGRLLYEMWRACRLVVDTGIHAFGWTRDQAIDFMKANTALSELNIVREVDRYIDWPGQACGYKIGELRIRELRAKAERELGAAFDLRAFHDTVLGAGAIPLDVLGTRVDAWIAARKAAAQPARAP